MTLRLFKIIGLAGLAFGILLTAIGNLGGGQTHPSLPPLVVRHAGWSDTQLVSGFNGLKANNDDPNVACEFNYLTERWTAVELHALSSDEQAAAGQAAYLDCH